MVSGSVRLVAGLGNPGKAYYFTRHNIGFLVVDTLVQRYKLVFRKNQIAEIAHFNLNSNYIIILKPLTYMNLSGIALSEYTKKYQISPSDIIIICDDIALPFGTIRIRKKGGSGGHNGLQNIIEHLQTNEFNRLRIGIGRNYQKGYQSQYVLSEWNESEKVFLHKIISTAVEAVEFFILEGIDKAMNKFNNLKIV